MCEKNLINNEKTYYEYVFCNDDDIIAKKNSQLKFILLTALVFVISLEYFQQRGLWLQKIENRKQFKSYNVNKHFEY